MVWFFSKRLTEPLRELAGLSEKMEMCIRDRYNTNVFAFGNTEVRKLLADIQVEEQNHAEMLYKYKMVNGIDVYKRQIWM